MAKKKDGKDFFIPFEIRLWLSDPLLRQASLQARGAWIDCLCWMWSADERGKLETTPKKLARLLSCSMEESIDFLNEVSELEFGDVEIDDSGAFPLDLGRCNANVTLVNRKMHQEYIDRQNTRLRVRRHRQKKKMAECNGNGNAKITDTYSYSKSYSYRNTHAKARESCKKNDEKNGHFTNKIGKLKTDIEDIAKKVENTFSKQKTNRPFNVYEWIQQKANIRGHPKAILDSLIFLAKIHEAEGVENPYGFLEKTFKSLNPKYNAREHEEESRAYKQMVVDDPKMESLLKGIG